MTAGGSTTTSTAKTRPSLRWRVVDIVVAAVIGVACGLVFLVWNVASEPLSGPLKLAFPGLQALAYGVWLLAGPLTMLIVRKPGAALFGELLAASVSAFIGNQWGGPLTLVSGAAQGLGAELVFAAFAYANWRAFVAVLAGAGAGVAMAITDLILWYPGADTLFMVVYTSGAIISGAILAGLLAWLAVRGLARTGALNRFAAGRMPTRS